MDFGNETVNMIVNLVISAIFAVLAVIMFIRWQKGHDSGSAVVNCQNSFSLPWCHVIYFSSDYQSEYNII